MNQGVRVIEIKIKGANQGVRVIETNSWFFLNNTGLTSQGARDVTLNSYKYLQHTSAYDSARKLSLRLLLPRIRLTNKGGGIGDEQFKQEIKAQLARKIQTGQYGGDRKSKRFKPSNQ